MATSYVYKRDASRLFIALRDNAKRFKIYLPKESKPIINGKEEDLVFVNHKNNFCSFVKDGINYNCEVTHQNQNAMTVLVNGVEYEFSLESIFSYLRQGLLNKNDKNNDARGDIKSHMPGKIVDIFVSEGDLINAGEPVLSLEAMKMQNELVAECNGIIRKIHVSQNQTVMQDELLVEISSIDE